MEKRRKSVIAIILMFAFCLAACTSEADRDVDSVSVDVASGDALSGVAADISIATPAPDGPPPRSPRTA